MTTDAAFLQLISNRQKCIKIGISPDNYRKLKQRFNNDELSQQLKTHWLEKAGYKYKITWIKPIS